jgi:hypothetical protein
MNPNGKAGRRYQKKTCPNDTAPATEKKIREGKMTSLSPFRRAYRRTKIEAIKDIGHVSGLYHSNVKIPY